MTLTRTGKSCLMELDKREREEAISGKFYTKYTDLMA